LNCYKIVNKIFEAIYFCDFEQSNKQPILNQTVKLRPLALNKGLLKTFSKYENFQSTNELSQ